MGGVGSGRKKAAAPKKAATKVIVAEREGIFTMEYLLGRLDYAKKVDRGKIANLAMQQKSHDRIERLRGRVEAWRDFELLLEGNEGVLD